MFANQPNKGSSCNFIHCINITELRGRKEGGGVTKEAKERKSIKDNRYESLFNFSISPSLRAYIISKRN